MTSRARTRVPGAVNWDIRNCISWQTTVSGSYGGPAYTKSGALPYIDYGDGTIGRWNDTHAYADGSTKTIKCWSPDGWDGLTYLRLSWSGCVGRLPHMPGCKNLERLEFDNNGFYDTDWKFNNCPALQQVWTQSNSLIGGDIGAQGWPACTALTHLNVDNGAMSGTVPDFSAATGLLYLYLGGANHTTTGYVHGSFSTQPGLYILGFWNHFWPQSEIDALLAELVVSLGLGSRVTCEVQLHGGNMGTPNAQGYTDAATLTAAGWTVYTN